MNERQDEIRERFEREVEIVRGAGGFAPTTDDLRAHGEQMAYAALPTREDEELHWLSEGIEGAKLNIACHWHLRHESDPNYFTGSDSIRDSIRESVVRIRAGREKLAAMEARRRERAES